MVATMSLTCDVEDAFDGHHTAVVHQPGVGVIHGVEADAQRHQDARGQRQQETCWR
jgi:hypothetical protein